MSTVIIGNGGAALEGIIAIRSGGNTEDIHLFSDSLFPAFNPTLLTYFLAGKICLEEIFLYSADFYDKHSVKLHLGSKVIRLDAENKTVENAAGVKKGYDDCIVCSGASPVIPKAYQGRRVYAIRSIRDAVALKSQITNKKRALVVGASLIGVKVVEALVLQGVDTSLYDIGEHVFPLSANKRCAELIESALAANGVRLHLREEAPAPSQYDLIIVCTGVSPNISFIDKTQVETDGGILVDKHMRTNREGLYAAGDVARVLDDRHENVAQGLWASARYMGRTAGRNIAGKIEACAPVIRHNSTRFFGFDFASIGDVSRGDDIFEMEAEGKYCALVWKEGCLTGINLFNMPEVSGILKSRVLGAQELSNIVVGKVFDKYPQIKEVFMNRRLPDENK